MTAADLADLPEPCAGCTFWESSLADLATSSDHATARRTKQDWAEAVTRHWGYCGVVAFNDDEIDRLPDAGPGRATSRGWAPSPRPR